MRERTPISLLTRTVKLSRSLPVFLALLIIVFLHAATFALIAFPQTTLTIKIRVIGKGLISVKYYGENNITKYSQITKLTEIQAVYGSILTVSIKPAKAFRIHSIIVDGRDVALSKYLSLKVGYDIKESLAVILSPELPVMKESPSLVVTPFTKLLSNGTYFLETVIRVLGNLKKNSELEVGLLTTEKVLSVKTIYNVTPNYYTFTFSFKAPLSQTYIVKAYLIDPSNETQASTETYIILHAGENNIQSDAIQNLTVYIIIALSITAVVLTSALLIKRGKDNI